MLRLPSLRPACPARSAHSARGFQTEAARGLSNEAKAFPPLPGRGPGTGSQVPTSNLQYSALVPGMVPGSTMSMRGKQRGKASPATSSQQRSSQEAARRNPLDKHNYPPLPGTGATQSPATISYAGLAKNGLGETVNMRGVGTVEKNVPLPSRRRPGAPPLEVGKGPLATPSSQSGSRVPSRHRPELSLSNKVTFPNLPGHGNRSSSQTGQPLPYGKLFKQAAAPEKRANVPVFRSAANPPPGGSKGAAAGTHAVDARSRSASRGRQPGPPGQPPKTPEHSRPRGRSLADSGLTRSTGTPAQQATRPLSNSPLLENWWEWEPK